MIKGDFEHILDFKNLFSGINSAIAFLKNQNLLELKDGKYQISGDEVYANVQTYKTRTEGDFEAHRNYIDLQYIVSGREKIGVSKLNDCVAVLPYDNQNDIEFYSSGKFDYFELSEGEFLILMPEDAHQPSMAVDAPDTVKKIVFKIRVDL